jgi:hypothetical protein
MVITVLLLAFAWLVAGLNFHFLWQSRKTARRVSMVPLVTQILVLLAWLIHSPSAFSRLSPWFFVGAASADVSF